MCLYSKYSKFCREFIFVLKQQEKILTWRRATRGLQALTTTLALTLTLTLGLTLTPPPHPWLDAPLTPGQTPPCDPRQDPPDP